MSAVQSVNFLNVICLIKFITKGIALGREVIKLFFGNFCLDIRPNAHVIEGRMAFKLFKNHDQRVPLKPRSLEVLNYLISHHGEELSDQQIYSDVWNIDGPDGGGNVHTHIALIREALEDDVNNPKFIKTTEKDDYIFIAKVTRDGDLGRVDGFSEWSRSQFFKLLDQVERVEEDKEDLRIVTTGFSCGVADLRIEELLRNHVRIKIIMMNPDNQALTHARFALRGDFEKHEDPVEEGTADIRRQFARLQSFAELPSTISGCRGSIEVRLSDAMPSGFIAHTRKQAILGLFLAQRSYVDGPMIEAHRDTQLWKMLYMDWKVRWDGKPTRKQTRRVR
jgi:DNA-binding winged helix-turn-helix (wHTH) protein